ncbi:hypothetical protein H5410_029746 [Solanum commersonii]|uniref:Uncharacterized protein n=1 Tax=Solanum commersonii TaxID=4109 RepID=A0A9J5YFH7_SOLCO|nr:hypothetical protein H5410_029746 [Solanum commersonii]
MTCRETTTWDELTRPFPEVEKGGQLGAVRYFVMFAVVGTTVDYATIRVNPALRSYYDSLVNKKNDCLAVTGTDRRNRKLKSI